MNLALENLTQHLTNKLAAIYVVSSDEHLLHQETCDAIRQTAKQQGFSERKVFTVERGFSWQDFSNATVERSLFSARQMLELRISTGKLGNDGVAAIVDYLQKPSTDIVVLLSLPKLDTATKNSKWMKALIADKNCQVVQIWPINQQDLPTYLANRCRAQNLVVDNQVLDFIAVKAQGNLLAAAQEITKLKLIFGDKAVDLQAAQAVISDSSRYSIFDLTDAMLAADYQHVAHILQHLAAENIEPILVLWALTRELRILVQLSFADDLNLALNDLKPRPNSKRRSLLQNVLSRHNYYYFVELLDMALNIDAQIKGQAAGNVWQSLQELSCKIAGQTINLEYQMYG